MHILALVFDYLSQFSVLTFQVGEFFYPAQKRAASQRREIGIQSNSRGSIDRPLLQKQVTVLYFLFIALYSFSLLLHDT